MSTKTSSKDCDNGSTDKAAQIPPPSQASHEWFVPPVLRASRATPASLESPASLALRGSLVSPVFPASEGQAIESDIEQELKKLAERTACTNPKRPERRRFRLARELATIQMQEGRKLTPLEVTTACREWFELSRGFLDPKETFEEHFTALIAEMGKAKVPTGEGALEKAKATVSKLSLWDLPEIPGWPGAHETWRRLAAIHRELSSANRGNTHFLSYRDSAEAIGVSSKHAFNITATLEGFGVIKIVDKGQAGTNRRKATEFRYLLPRSENGPWEDSGLAI